MVGDETGNEVKRKVWGCYLVPSAMAVSDQEKVVRKALQRLTPTFVKKLHAKDVRHELYGREQLTWMEYESIGRYCSAL